MSYFRNKSISFLKSAILRDQGINFIFHVLLFFITTDGVHFTQAVSQSII
jgi:hypothetical protein